MQTEREREKLDRNRDVNAGKRQVVGAMKERHLKEGGGGGEDEVSPAESEARLLRAEVKNQQRAVCLYFRENNWRLNFVIYSSSHFFVFPPFFVLFPPFVFRGFVSALYSRHVCYILNDALIVVFVSTPTKTTPSPHSPPRNPISCPKKPEHPLEENASRSLPCTREADGDVLLFNLFICTFLYSFLQCSSFNKVVFTCFTTGGTWPNRFAAK